MHISYREVPVIIHNDQHGILRGFHCHDRMTDARLDIKKLTNSVPVNCVYEEFRGILKEDSCS